jgi:DNA-binding protein HU-beta
MPRGDHREARTDEGIRMSLNKSELVSAIAAKSDLTKAQAENALNAFQEVLVESLGKGEAVKVTGLLSVERVERAARTGRNPRTGEEIQIPAGFGVKISAGSLLKKAVTK